MSWASARRSQRRRAALTLARGTFDHEYFVEVCVLLQLRETLQKRRIRRLPDLRQLS